MGGACCTEINACYESRRCKLILECITAHCPRTLGPSMAGLGEAPPGTAERMSAAVCNSGAGPEGESPPCIQRCLDEFAPVGDSGTTDDEAGRCLAFSVYACGAREKCGPVCGAAEAGAYSQRAEWLEDQLSGAPPPSTDASP
jgi:hypothetical protein